VISYIVPVLTRCAGMKVGRGINVGDPEFPQVRKDLDRSLKVELAMKLQPISG
jgi:hypothetical protein